MLSLMSPMSALSAALAAGVFGDVSELVVDAQEVLDHLIVQLARQTLAFLLALDQESSLGLLQSHVRLIERLDLVTELLDELLVERALRFQASLQQLLLLAQSVGPVAGTAEAVERPQRRGRLPGSIAGSEQVRHDLMASDFVGTMRGHAGPVPEDEDAVCDREEVLQLLAAEHDRDALLAPREDASQEPLLGPIGQLLRGFIDDDQPR